MSTPALDAPTSRRGRWRWLVALVSTIVLVVSGSGLVAFAQSGSGISDGPQFVPADAPIYLEARLDMPDGQGEALAEFMTAFPGFADAGSFQLKLDEAVDGLIAEASDGAMSMSDLQGFLTGELGLSLTDLSAEVMDSDQPPMLIGIGISDRAAAETFVSGVLPSASPESYGTTSIYSDEDAAVAVHDAWILLAPDADQVKAGIDVLDGNAPSLAADPEFAASFAKVPAGHLGAVYVDLQAMGSLIEMGLAASGQTGMALPIEDLMAQLPLDMVAYLAAAPDRMTLEAFITPSEATPSFPVGESDLASLFPGDTQVYVEIRELGALLAGLLSGFVASMDEETAAEMEPVEDMLGAPLPDFLDFVSDASIGAGLSSDGLWLGIAGEVSDEAIAAERLERIISIVNVLGGAAESDISVETVMVGDTEVHEITLPIDAASMGLPFDIGQTLSLAVSDGGLLIGTGDFVVNALTQPATDSLGASDAYTDALGDDTSNSGVVYVNVGSLLAELDPLLNEMMPEWADIQPYATALDRLVAVGTAGDEVISARITVIVGQ